MVRNEQDMSATPTILRLMITRHLQYLATSSTTLYAQELESAYLREKRNHHHAAALSAFSYADQLEQLSRPVGRSAGVWLGRAAVAAETGKAGAALDDLELALVQLRKNAKVDTG